MATYDALFRAGLLLSLTDQASRPARQLSQNLEQLRTRADNLQKTFKTMAKTGAIMAGAGAAMAAGLSVPASRAADLQSSLAEINTVAQLSTSQIDILRKGALKLSPALNMDLSSVTSAMYNLNSAGIQYADTLKVTELAGKAAVAGVTDINTAGTLGVQVMNAYGKNVGDLPGIFDKLLMTVRQGVTTMPQMASSLGQVLSIAEAGNVPLEQLLASYATLTKGGIESSQASTALRGLIQALAAPTSQAGKKLHELGGEQLQAAIQAGDLTKAIGLLAPKLDNLAKVREAIPEIEGAKAIARLMSSHGELQKTLEKTINSQGTTNEMFQMMNKTSKFAWGSMKKSMSAFITTVGYSLLPAMKSVSNMFKSASTWLMNFAENHKTLTKFVMGGAAAVSGLLIVLGTLLGTVGLLGIAITSGIKYWASFKLWLLASGKSASITSWAISGLSKFLSVGLVGSAKAALVALKSLSVFMFTTPWGLAFVALTVAALAIYKYWEPIKAFFSGLWKGFSESMAPAFEGLRNFYSAVSPVLGLLGDLWGWFMNLIAPVDASAKTLDKASSIGEKVGRALAFILKWGNPVVLMFRAVSKVSQVISNAFSGLDLYQIGKKLMVDLGKGITDWAKSPWESMAKAAKGLRDYLPFSPAKIGPLRDLNKLKISQEIAKSITPDPILARMQNVLNQAMQPGLVPAGPGGGFSGASPGLGRNFGTGPGGFHVTIENIIIQDSGSNKENAKKAGEEIAYETERQFRRKFKV